MEQPYHVTTTFVWLGKEGQGEHKGLAPLRYRIEGDGRHTTAQNLSFLRPLGFTELDRAYKITVEPVEHEYI